ncbi:MAG TPA: hypothetical protein VN706_10785 [Gemmatimonadaceae bacterium]|nr:hypothetical protein [Gemmatimonadaceae bacterium]
MTECVENIGERGARRRRLSGYGWAAIAAGALAIMLAERAPRWPRLLLAVPIALAAIGFLQAREKT